MKLSVFQKQILALVLAAGPLLTTSEAATPSYQTIDMLALGKGNASIANTGISTASFPFGSPSTLGGVPFVLTNLPNQVWAALNATGGTGQGLVSETFPMVVNDIYGFYTLANNYWGYSNETHVTYRFNFSDNTSYEKTLTNGIDLRDFNGSTTTFATTINNTTTQNVYSATDPNNLPFGLTYLDRQWIDLAAAGHGGKNLVSFTVIDDGGAGINRIFLSGATAQIGIAGQQIPEPGVSTLLLLTGLGACLYRRDRTKKSASATLA